MSRVVVEATPRAGVFGWRRVGEAVPVWVRAVTVIALAGMAYCHLADVGMKFDEHVYYMAALFCCNIAASLLLIPAVALAGDTSGRGRLAWLAAGVLALLTIAGFLWSRTVGFPQMADHIGQWDALGLASVGFELTVVATSVWVLGGRSRGYHSPRR